MCGSPTIYSGAGVKFDLIRNTFWKMNVGSALLNRQRVLIESKDTYNHLILSVRWVLKVFFEKNECGITLFYKPILNDPGTLWTSDMYIKLKIYQNLDFKVGFNSFIDTHPLGLKKPIQNFNQYVRLSYSI